MNARSYIVKLNPPVLDFPVMNGLGKQSDFTQTEPPVIIDKKVVLKITRKFILTDMYNNKEYEVITIQPVYEIPVNEINTREDIYEFYKDATLCLSQAYQYIQRQEPTLPNLSFNTQPIESYQREIDGVFYLLNSMN